MVPALNEIKVLDLCHLGPGMFCTMILADFGAEVVRIERPELLLTQDNVEKSPWDFGRMMELQNRALNRNKRSISLNFKTDGARQVFYKLAETADVIVEGFRPGVTKKLGIDYDKIKEINPRIIYCSLSGFGQSGPYAELPGHDVTYIALGGVLNMIGEPDRPPTIPMNFIADFAGASLHATIGILIALTARTKTAQGQYVDISYTDAVASLNTLFAFDYLNYGVDYPRGTTPLNGGSPGYGVYLTKDGKYIAIGCAEPWFWENLCRFVGREDYIPYQMADGGKKQEVFDYMRQFFLNKNRDEWFELIRDKNIPVGKVYGLDEVFADPQLQHRQMLQELELPDGSKEKTVGMGIKLSGTPGQIRCPAPVPGQHTKETLTRLGYTQELIDELARQGSIAMPHT